MTPSPIAARLFALQVSPRPKDAEELAYLEEYMGWVAKGGVDQHEAKRTKERFKQGRNHDRLMKFQQTKP